MWNINAENKCKEVERGTRDNQIFPVVSRSWRSPLIHVGALTKSIAPPQVMKTQVLTKSTRSPSPERWVSDRVHQDFLEAPTTSKSSLRTLQTPRPSRSCQSPRLTNPHTFTWPEHSAKPWYAPWNPRSLRKSSPNKKKMNPKWEKEYLFLFLAVVDLQSGKGSSRNERGHMYRPKERLAIGKVPWKVVQSDELTVPLVLASDHSVSHIQPNNRWSQLS
jgi:hypothetical protein